MQNNDEVAGKKTIMVVDDEPDVLLSIVQILEANDYSTIEARDGYACLEKLKEEVPDLILLDIMMPGLTSMEILNSIAKDSRLAKIKIIFITAVHSLEAEEEGLLTPNQVSDYIEKPFSVKRLLNAIQEAVES
ncbi:MAG: transcriptional regulator PhoB [Candidatus Syntrophoarchaeum sp. GoM_oil]|nr:MAG: transcriptional regulator PhoB [Candidatus Syntrophoarchaeum sp. GoM_oil]